MLLKKRMPPAAHTRGWIEDPMERMEFGPETESSERHYVRLALERIAAALEVLSANSVAQHGAPDPASRIQAMVQYEYNPKG